MSEINNIPVFMNNAGIICSLGNGLDAVADKLFSDTVQQHEHLKVSPAWEKYFPYPVGAVMEELPITPIADEDSRCNRLLTEAINPLLPEIEALKTQFGPTRIAIVVGTSTAGIAEAEIAVAAKQKTGQFTEGYHYRKQELYAPSRYLSRWLGLQGPCFSVSSACTSGAKALATAARLLKLGVCDAVIAGGVDTLCQMTLSGFDSLAVTTSGLCNPFSANRRGINIGEGAGIFLVTREPGPVRFMGSGESSDAHHISAPHPEGIGAELSMCEALQMAGIKPGDVDYLNFHGTATEQNDRMEAHAAKRVLGSDIACGSTKGLTGHTLAAAGAIEAVFCWMTLQRDDGALPRHLWDGQSDTELPVLGNLALRHHQGLVSVAMSNSFAFGGNNISLLLARAT